MTSQLESLRRYVADHRPYAVLPEQPGRVVLVGSGKGGVGTSTVAALLSVMAAAEGEDVLLVDADESHGTAPLLFGVEPPVPVSRLLEGSAAPAELLVTVGHGLALLPAGGTADPEDRLPASERRGLMRRIATLFERFDLVIVDAGSRLDQVLGALSLGATRFVAVTAAERISAAATYALVKTVDAHAPRLRVDLLFNRCRLSAATAGFDEVDAATRHFLERSVEFAGAVPDDERLRNLLEAGTPLPDAAAFGSPATSACHELAVRLIEQIQERPLAVVAPRHFPRR